MEDRIKIGDEWYVKEDKKIIGFKNFDDDITQYEGIVLEDDKHCFDVTRLSESECEDGDDRMLSIEYKIKSGKMEDWVTGFIDNDYFLIGIMESHPDTMLEARETMDDDLIDHLRFVCIELKKLDWI